MRKKYLINIRLEVKINKPHNNHLTTYTIHNSSILHRQHFDRYGRCSKSNLHRIKCKYTLRAREHYSKGIALLLEPPGDRCSGSVCATFHGTSEQKHPTSGVLIQLILKLIVISNIALP